MWWRRRWIGFEPLGPPRPRAPDPYPQEVVRQLDHVRPPQNHEPGDVVAQKDHGSWLPWSGGRGGRG